jgi:hypothetical protein
MNWLSVAVIALAFAGPRIKPADASKLAELVRGIRGADYRAEREELRRLAARLDEVKDPRLAAYREYWRGFARWRRALNAFNETPNPGDILEDLEGAIGSFRAALVRQPEWIEAKVGIAGCSASLFCLVGQDAKRRDALLTKYLPVWKDMSEKGQQNPRVLWLVGGSQVSAPPPGQGRLTALLILPTLQSRPWPTWASSRRSSCWRRCAWRTRPMPSPSARRSGGGPGAASLAALSTPPSSGSRRRAFSPPA